MGKLSPHGQPMTIELNAHNLGVLQESHFAPHLVKLSVFPMAQA